MGGGTHVGVLSREEANSKRGRVSVLYLEAEGEAKGKATPQGGKANGEPLCWYPVGHKGPQEQANNAAEAAPLEDLPVHVDAHGEAHDRSCHHAGSLQVHEEGDERFCV